MVKNPPANAGNGKETDTVELLNINMYIWTSLLAQPVKNLPAMWGTWVGKIPWASAVGSATGSGTLKSFWAGAGVSTGPKATS